MLKIGLDSYFGEVMMVGRHALFALLLCLGCSSGSAELHNEAATQVPQMQVPQQTPQMASVTTSPSTAASDTSTPQMQQLPRVVLAVGDLHAIGQRAGLPHTLLRMQALTQEAQYK